MRYFTYITVRQKPTKSRPQSSVHTARTSSCGFDTDKKPQIKKTNGFGIKPLLFCIPAHGLYEVGGLVLKEVPHQCKLNSVVHIGFSSLICQFLSFVKK